MRNFGIYLNCSCTTGPGNCIIYVVQLNQENSMFGSATSKNSLQITQLNFCIAWENNLAKILLM